MAGWHQDKFDEDGPWFFPGGHFNHVPSRIVIFNSLAFGAGQNIAAHTMDPRTRCVRPLYQEPNIFVRDKDLKKITVQFEPQLHTASCNPHGERFYITKGDVMWSAVPRDEWPEEFKDYKTVYTIVKTDVQGRPMAYEPLLKDGKEIVNWTTLGVDLPGSFRGVQGFPSSPIVMCTADDNIMLLWFCYSQGFEECRKRLFFSTRRNPFGGFGGGFDFSKPQAYYPAVFLVRKYDRDLKLIFEKTHKEADGQAYIIGYAAMGAWGTAVRPTPDGGALLFIQEGHDPDEFEERYLENVGGNPSSVTGIGHFQALSKTIIQFNQEKKSWQVGKISSSGDLTKDTMYTYKSAVSTPGLVTHLEVNKQGKALIIASKPVADGTGLNWTHSAFIGEPNGTDNFVPVDTGYVYTDLAFGYKRNIPPGISGGLDSVRTYVDDDGNFYIVTSLDRDRQVAGYTLQEQIWKLSPEGKLIKKINRLDDQIRMDQVRQVGYIDRDGYIIAKTDNEIKFHELGNEKTTELTQGLRGTPYNADQPIVEIDPDGKVTRGFLWRFSSFWRPDNHGDPPKRPPYKGPPDQSVAFQKEGAQDWAAIFGGWVYGTNTFYRELDLIGQNRLIPVIEYPGYPAIFQLPEYLRRRPETDPRREILYGKGKNQVWPRREGEGPRTGRGEP